MKRFKKEFKEMVKVEGYHKGHNPLIKMNYGYQKKIQKNQQMNL